MQCDVISYNNKKNLFYFGQSCSAPCCLIPNSEASLRRTLRPCLSRYTMCVPSSPPPSSPSSSSSSLAASSSSPSASSASTTIVQHKPHMHLIDLPNDAILQVFHMFLVSTSIDASCPSTDPVSQRAAFMNVLRTNARLRQCVSDDMFQLKRATNHGRCHRCGRVFDALSYAAFTRLAHTRLRHVRITPRNICHCLYTHVISTLSRQSPHATTLSITQPLIRPTDTDVDDDVIALILAADDPKLNPRTNNKNDCKSTALPWKRLSTLRLITPSKNMLSSLHSMRARLPSRLRTLHLLNVQPQLEYKVRELLASNDTLLHFQFSTLRHSGTCDIYNPGHTQNDDDDYHMVFFPRRGIDPFESTRARLFVPTLALHLMNTLQVTSVHVSSTALSSPPSDSAGINSNVTFPPVPPYSLNSSASCCPCCTKNRALSRLRLHLASSPTSEKPAKYYASFTRGNPETGVDPDVDADVDDADDSSEMQFYHSAQPTISSGMDCLLSTPAHLVRLPPAALSTFTPLHPNLDRIRNHGPGQANRTSERISFDHSRSRSLPIGRVSTKPSPSPTVLSSHLVHAVTPAPVPRIPRALTLLDVVAVPSPITSTTLSMPLRSSPEGSSQITQFQSHTQPHMQPQWTLASHSHIPALLHWPEPVWAMVNSHASKIRTLILRCPASSPFIPVRRKNTALAPSRTAHGRASLLNLLARLDALSIVDLPSQLLPPCARSAEGLITVLHNVQTLHISYTTPVVLAAAANQVDLIKRMCLILDALTSMSAAMPRLIKIETHCSQRRQIVKRDRKSTSEILMDSDRAGSTIDPYVFDRLECALARFKCRRPCVTVHSVETLRENL